MVEKEYVSWQDVTDFLNTVADHYKDANITGVYGFPTGGAIMAAILSKRMDIAWLMAPSGNCIIIDDIADSGETLLHYDRNSSGEKRKNYHIVTMYWKETSLVKPEFYSKIKTDKWIVYPWENI